jgi:serine protease Do
MSKRVLFGMVLVAGLGVVLKTRAASPPPKVSQTPFCSGQYADDFTALSAAARDFDHRPEATFSYCTRNVAVYECLSYGSDGAIRRDRRRVTLHGTAFAYRKQGGDTLLLTNDHVAAWPGVTDGQHTVDEVPAGCKRVSETLTLVDDEHDTYGKDDIPLTRIATDPQLDIGVLKAHADLHVMPWKVGHSAGIRERNLVEVRGFPLGAFRATNTGKVISAHDHDDFGDWDHDDFIVDALLSRGNSGSPVLGISCATGEYELVGVYHAGYSEGSALNAVIGVDQIRDLMSTLKRTPRDRGDTPVAVDAAARNTIIAALSGGDDAFFPLGTQVALARQAAAGAILFALLPKDFPSVGTPALVVEDLPTTDPSSFGVLGRIWLGSSRGLRRHELSDFDAEGQGQLKHALAALRADLAAQLAYRAAQEETEGSRQSEGGLRRLAKALARAAASRGDLLQGIAELAEHWSPQPGEKGERLAVLGRPEPEGAPPATIARSTIASPSAPPLPFAKPPQ